jgi:acyl carrier protein
MTDLQYLTKIKEKPFVTNCFMPEREIFDDNDSCNFENQITDEVFCFFKKTNDDFKNMFFYATQNVLLAKNPILNKDVNFVTEVFVLEHEVEKSLQIKNWLNSQGNYHYHTVFRMNRVKQEQEHDINYSLIQNPNENDLEVILKILEKNFDKYTERIPTLEKLKEFKNSIYLIKEDNKIAALFVTEIKGSTRFMHFWLVISEFRGKGYGELIFKYCLNCNPDIKRYTSWINVKNNYSIKKHSEFGFVKDRIINFIYLNINIMKEKIIKILEDTRPEFDFHDESVNFITAEYLDSFDIITLVVDIESTFDVKIIGALILPDNFSSVDAILKLIEISKDASQV